MTIVNFSTEVYLPGQERLRKSVDGKANFIGLSDYRRIKSPTHQASPYEFKIHALQYAFNSFPNENIFLWLDSSAYVVGDLSRIEKLIQDDGFFGEESGHYVNDWCNQHTRQYFRLKPEENYTMYSAGLTGLNLQNQKAMEFFSHWKASAKAGCFKGEWSNHRHDMTCASIIAQRLGMKYQRGGDYIAYIGESFGEPNPEAVFHLQGIA